MKKKAFLGLLTVGMLLLPHGNAYAEEFVNEDAIPELENVQEYVSQNVARIVGTPRGMLISSVEISIIDLGGGTARIYGDVLCHEAMEKIKLNLYLDKWISADEDWSQIQNWNFVWNAEDYPDEDLTMAMVSMEVPDLERGVDYQVRGIAGAWDLDSDLYEVFRADVPSILIE